VQIGTLGSSAIGLENENGLFPMMSILILWKNKCLPLGYGYGNGNNLIEINNWMRDKINERDY
jgi:hypothetical protein